MHYEMSNLLLTEVQLLFSSQGLGVIDSETGLFLIKKNTIFLVSMDINLRGWECLVPVTVEN